MGNVVSDRSEEEDGITGDGWEEAKKRSGRKSREEEEEENEPSSNVVFSGASNVEDLAVSAMEGGVKKGSALAGSYDARDDDPKLT